MDANKHEIVYKELSYQIISAALEVHNGLGAGFLEKVYENALAIKLRKSGLKAEQQDAVKVKFEGEVVGKYFADILVDDKVILELKCVKEIVPVHEAQVLNYLKATNLKLGIIINFNNPKLEYKRIVL
ncbi:MAG: GxxExxY protein [Candidatus Brocadiia bacterium]